MIVSLSFLAILILDFQTDHLTKSVAFERWPIFKIVSFLE